MIFPIQSYCFFNLILFIIILILQTPACVIDGSQNPENGTSRTASNIMNRSNKRSYHDSRRSSNIDGEINHSSAKIRENGHKKRKTYKRRYKGNSKRHYGNNRLHDGTNKHVGYRRYDGNNRRYDGNNRRYDVNNRRYDGNNRRYNVNNRRYDGNNTSYDGNIMRRQGSGAMADLLKKFMTPTTTIPPEFTDSNQKYRDKTTIKVTVPRPTPYRVSLEEDCDYIAYYCLKAYKTGPVCGRTLYYNYQNFTSYCMLDYVNCMERYEVWQIVHMGYCINITRTKDYQHYEYQDDSFLDQVYVIQE